jgi:hypothetical protein
MIEEYMMCWESMDYNVWICNNPDLFTITNLVIIVTLLLIVIYGFRNMYANAIIRQEDERKNEKK